MTHGGYSPSFIDSDGRECAVANLIIESGYRELATQIASTTNYAFVRNMHGFGLERWVQQSGLTLDELTQIQPAYISTYVFIIFFLISVIAFIISLALLVIGITPASQTLFILSSVCAIPFVSLLMFQFPAWLYRWGKMRRLRKLKHRKGATAIHQLIASLDSSDFSVRQTAKAIVLEMDTDVIPALSKVLLESPVSRKRLFVAGILARKRDRAALPALYATLENSQGSEHAIILKNIREIEESNSPG
jgi:hypothetical protein